MWAKAKCKIKIRINAGTLVHIPKGEICQVIDKESYSRTLSRYTLRYKGVEFKATEGYRLLNFEIFEDSLSILCWNRLTKAFLH